MQIDEARKANSYHQTNPNLTKNSNLKEGQSMEEALQACQHQVRQGRWAIPSQLHFYMEPQTAVAQGDGEGGMEVSPVGYFLQLKRWEYCISVSGVVQVELNNVIEMCGLFLPSCTSVWRCRPLCSEGMVCGVG